MDAERIDNRADIVIIGIALRTSNAEAMATIAAHWGRFMQEGIAARLPQKPDDAAVYAVYCDYEADHTRAYTLVLGVAVDARAEVPAGMRRVRVPAGAYAR